MIAAIFSKLLARWALAATRVFYDIGRHGPELPPGPLLVVANHPNSIMDALVLFSIAGRRVSPLARAPLFERPFIGQVLRELGGLPVYRPQDRPELVGRNDSTFDAAVEALRGGAAVLIFPEGMSHSEPEIAPLRTGAARIALRAEEESDWKLGLRIVPVGLTYRRKTRFRGEVAAYVGEPRRVDVWKQIARQDNVNAVRLLTEDIAAALEGVTLHFSGRENEPLLDAAEALYATEHRLEEPGEEPPLSKRLPRLQLFGEGMNWLRAHDPERLWRLAAAVRAYRARLARLGLREGELPERQSARHFLRLLGMDGAIALLGLPVVVIGVVAWYVPYSMPRFVLMFHKPAYEARATVKLVTALAAFPIVYGIWLWLAWRNFGPGAAALAALVLPIAGLATMHWREHWADFRQEAIFVLRAMRRRGLADQLRARRRVIAAEIDRIAEEWETETRRRLPNRPAAPRG